MHNAPTLTSAASACTTVTNMPSVIILMVRTHVNVNRDISEMAKKAVCAPAIIIVFTVTASELLNISAIVI